MFRRDDEPFPFLCLIGEDYSNFAPFAPIAKRQNGPRSPLHFEVVGCVAHFLSGLRVKYRVKGQIYSYFPSTPPMYMGIALFY